MGRGFRRHVASQMLTRQIRTLVSKYLSAKRALLVEKVRWKPSELCLPKKIVNQNQKTPQNASSW